MLDQRIPIRMLILPKFQPGVIGDGTPGEAQDYYEAYCRGGEAYDLRRQTLYVRDGVALLCTGVGKVNAALALSLALTDPRFDFSPSYFLSTGCAGSAAGMSVMGDVFLITATVDFDLGHHADARDLSDPDALTWFRDSSNDERAHVLLDPALMDKAYALIKDLQPETTPLTRKHMAASFPGEAWATREPRVLRGTAVTGDNYWKGAHDHENALLMVKTYGCPDPYAVSEMEDHAVALTLRRFGLLHRLLILRGSVNLDVFMNGQTPESLWQESSVVSITSEDSQEAADIFPLAMKNIFVVGRVLVDAVVDGRLG